MQSPMICCLLHKDIGVNNPSIITTWQKVSAIETRYWEHLSNHAGVSHGSIGNNYCREKNILTGAYDNIAID